MLSYIGLIGFEFTVIEMNKNNLKRGESLTYTIGETLTCTIGESLTPFEVQHEASNRCLSKDKKREYNNFPITPEKNKMF